MNEFEIIFRSIKDFFTKPMLKIALLPLIITMLLLYIIFFTAADFGFDALKVVIDQSSNNQEVIINETAPFYFIWLTYLIVFLFKYSITAWLVGFLFYTIGAIFVMMFSMFLTLIIIGFLSPMILKILHKRHYSSLVLNGNASLLSPLFVLIKSTFVMLLLFILLFPLYFIPLINILAFNLPFYYFFHKLLNFDVSSTLLNEDEYKIIYEKNSLGFRTRTLLLYLVSMIPFITMFSAVFYIIYLGNAYFVKLESLRLSSIDNLNTSLDEDSENMQSKKSYKELN